MKKRLVLPFLMIILCGVILCLIIFLVSPKLTTNPEKPNRFPNQIRISKEVCKQLLNNHGEAFDTLVIFFSSCVVEYDLKYCIRVSEKGEIEMPSSLNQDMNLIDAINDIYSDDFFRTNPFEIRAFIMEDGDIFIEIMLEYGEGYTTFMEYRKDIEELRNAEIIDDHWFLYTFRGI